LLRTDYQTTVRQLPLLGNIPILGALFRSTGFQKGETELLIVVTPRLVAPIRPDQVRLPTDRIADPQPVDVLLTGDSYRPIPLAPVAGALPAEAAVPATTDATTPEGDGYDY
jgi:pilus assembly protein CpaC